MPNLACYDGSEVRGEALWQSRSFHRPALAGISRRSRDESQCILRAARSNACISEVGRANNFTASRYRYHTIPC